MAKVKAVIRQDKINSKNETPIYLRVTKDRKTTFISLQISVLPNYWDKDKECIKKNNKIKGYVRLNNYIENEKVKMMNKLLESEIADQSLSTKKIKEIIKGDEHLDFFEYAEKYLKSIENTDSVRLYTQCRTVLNKLERFKKSRNLRFTDLTVSYLKDFAAYLSSECKNKTNTVSTNLKVIRKIYNLAILEELIPEDKSPFRKLKLDWENSNIDYLTEVDIEKLRRLHLLPNTKDYHVRNLFLFAIFAGGIRISDLLMLRWNNITDDKRIKIFTQKTKTNITIKLTNVASEILSQYNNHDTASNFIFPFLKSEGDYRNPKYLYKKISSLNASINLRLKAIARKAKIEKKLHFHMSRHTFATRGLELGMPLSHISKIMGHSSVKITENYAKLVNKELDKAMDLIDQYEETNNNRQL